MERALIRLHRQYGKDELVATLKKQLADAKVESGKLKAEVDHLMHELDLLRNDRDAKLQGRIEAKKEEFTAEVIAENKRLKAELKTLTDLRDRLMCKVFALERSLNANGEKDGRS